MSAKLAQETKPAPKEIRFAVTEQTTPHYPAHVNAFSKRVGSGEIFLTSGVTGNPVAPASEGEVGVLPFFVDHTCAMTPQSAITLINLLHEALAEHDARFGSSFVTQK